MSDNPGGQTSLKGLFQGLVPDPCGILQGKVISASPLRIQAVNDEKLIINALLLIVPKHLTDYTATVDISVGKGTLTSVTKTDGAHEHSGGTHGGHDSGNGSHTHDGGAHSHTLKTFAISGGTMKVYNALKVGEQVHLLSLNNGKKYYVLDRVV